MYIYYYVQSPEKNNHRASRRIPNGMYKFYEILSGPGLWFAFIVFIGGLILRLTYLFALSREKDKVFYNHMSLSWGLRSIGHWLIPLGSVSMRNQPVFAVVFYVFHICLLGVPLFLSAHNFLWDEAFGISLWSMPDRWADALTMVLMGTVVFLFIRRLARPEVRILTSFWDYFVLVLTLLPFITGFLAYHQWGSYDTMLILHILSAEILLIVVPFSKLAHVLLFFFTRAFIGFEMGGRRKARAW
jgi:nitrate reductase gamma subunit